MKVIDFLQRFIIVHSYIYYECDDNFLTDKEYDMKAQELVRYKNEYPDLWKRSMYYKQFGDEYNGATGFTLYHELDDRQKEIIRAIAGYRHEARKRLREENKKKENETL